MQTALQGLDTNKVNKSGDTMTGMLTLPSTTPSLGNHATNKAYVDTANSSQDAVISGKVSKSGDVMSGPLEIATAPTIGAHVTNKTYVDNVSLDCGAY